MLALVDRIKLLSQFKGKLYQLQGCNAQPPSLETTDDLPSQPPLHPIGLNDD
jgi:hypothetical protein